MFKNVLIATDGSDLAQIAVEKGLKLGKSLGAEVTIVTVTPSWPSMMAGDAALSLPVEEYERAASENAAAVLSAVRDAAKRIGVECVTRHEANQLPAEGILSAADAISCDLIVMASHGRRGLYRLFLGSQAQKVLTHATVPVLICR
jgi:nucleotide-binding universal stress UspA family protein